MTTFLVWCPYLGSQMKDSQKIDARSPELAAERWAEENDVWFDHLIAGSRVNVNVHVTSPSGVQDTFEVRGETQAHYYATRKAS